MLNNSSILTGTLYNVQFNHVPYPNQEMSYMLIKSQWESIL